jgi:hypothetical protein
MFYYLLFYAVFTIASLIFLCGKFKTTIMENIIDIEQVKETHDKLREILMKYNNPEYGDCIIDEICLLFSVPTTIDTELEEEKEIPNKSTLI